jgi:hypothetical protein
MLQIDEVMVAEINVLHGLERPVVVWLVGRRDDTDAKLSDDLIDVQDRRSLVTRCTTQLIIVDVPR